MTYEKELMKINQVQFITSAPGIKECPPPQFPEIAFAGRSNVGKSSLINFLLMRKSLAKVSNTPGKTRLLNFFAINEKFYLVDLPGYGFTKMSSKGRAPWQQMIEGYLMQRKTLRAVVLLLDCRREPNELDALLYGWLKEGGIPCICILTKIDKIAKTKRLNRVKELSQTLGLDLLRFSVTSTTKKIGRNETWKLIRPLDRKSVV